MRLIRRTGGIKRGRVGDPIDPEFLRVTGQIVTDTFLGTPKMFIGEGNQVYRVFLNRGTWNANHQIGLISIKAFSGREEGEEYIHFLRVNRDGGEDNSHGKYGPNQAVFRIEGRVRCLANIPQSWELRSAVYDYSNNQEGVMMDDTELNESYTVKDYEMIVSINGQIYRRNIPSGRFMSELNILRMINHLPFGKDLQGSFILLEGFSVLKPDAQIVYTGFHDAPEFSSNLHSFTMMGRGIVPYDFWLDEEHRLIGCISGGLGLAYIPESLMITPLEDFISNEFNKDRVK